MDTTADDGELECEELGVTTVYYGAKRGKYPHGNSLVVRGSDERIIIDPSLGIVARAPSHPPADRVLISHCHEDHVAGCHLYHDLPWHLHEADLAGIRSLDGMLAIYGFPDAIEAGWREALVSRFHYTPNADAIAYRDGDVFDLGGGARIHVIHLPGHTRGHCAFLIEPDGVLYLGDIDLSSFGPYYGDAWSSLEAFERSLARVREIDAAYYATFHHIGVLRSRAEFVERLDRFSAVIADRERRLVEFLSEPRSMDDIVRHRFVYRPNDQLAYADGVERRSMGMHLDRLLRSGIVGEDSGLYSTRSERGSSQA
jgi:glyoxylase-like metal-dependent hydrolase (beta-lactamase superfamily II)